MWETAREICDLPACIPFGREIYTASMSLAPRGSSYDLYALSIL